LAKKVIITGPAYPYRGGIASFNERLAYEFQALGWTVSMITYTLQYPDIIFPGKNQYSPDPAPTELDIHRMYSSINPISWRKTRKWIINEKPDLITSRLWIPVLGMSSGYIMRSSRKLSSCQSVSIVDNLIPHQHMVGDTQMVDYYMNSSDHYVAMSQSVLDDISDRYPSERATLIPHPIYDHYGAIVSREEAIGSLGLDQYTRYMLFFGYIKDYKGLDLLLESVPKDYCIQQNIKLIIAGEFYGKKDKYLKIISDREIGDLVIINDKFISNEQIKNYFSVSDIIVQTYHSATQSGISQLALYYEKPIIVTDVGGLSETIIEGETGYIVLKDKAIIAESIKSFFSSTDQDKMRDNIKLQKKNYSWSNYVKQLLAFSMETKTNS